MALTKLRRDAGEHLDDDATLLLLARHVLGGPTDDGRASYQIALDVCDDCERARQLSDGELIGVSPAAAEMARCDAQWLPRAHVGTSSNERAAQDIAPAVRRTVLRRDHRRCQVPGCKHATYLDLHHVEARANGGGHDEDNLITLCGAHHVAVHAGALVLRSDVDSGLRFWHADGTSYGSLPAASRGGSDERVILALCGLGFREREARRAHELTLRSLEPGAELDTVLRSCLELLTERVLSRSA